MRQALPFVVTLITLNASAQVVINEVDYDQIGTDNAEYIEIKNIGTTVYPMQYLTVLLINGSSGTGVQYASISNPSWQPLAPGAYFVICGNQSLTLNCDHPGPSITNLVQNGPMDAIVLVDVNDNVVDVLSYGGTLPGYVEGTGTTATDTNDQDGISLNRWPDGNDTNDNNADFVVGCPSPGTANVLDSVNCVLVASVASIDAGPSFTVRPSADGSELMVFMGASVSGSVSFSVFAADGALVLQQNVPGQANASWSFSTADRHGQLLFLQANSAKGSFTRRVVVP